MFIKLNALVTITVSGVAGSFVHLLLEIEVRSILSIRKLNRLLYNVIGAVHSAIQNCLVCSFVRILAQQILNRI